MAFLLRPSFNGKLFQFFPILGLTFYLQTVLYRESAPIKQSEIDRYKGLLYHGVPVSAILQAWSICQIQPDPGFSDDNNYLKNAIAEAEHVDFHNGLEKQTVIAPDGTDITEVVEKAVAWLTEHSF